eukprot:scaffold43102_cov60-Phaeocystis_antarctica.AAC.1
MERRHVRRVARRAGRRRRRRRGAQCHLKPARCHPLRCFSAGGGGGRLLGRLRGRLARRLLRALERARGGAHQSEESLGRV